MLNPLALLMFETVWAYGGGGLILWLWILLYTGVPCLTEVLFFTGGFDIDMLKSNRLQRHRCNGRTFKPVNDFLECEMMRK